MSLWRVDAIYSDGSGPWTDDVEAPDAEKAEAKARRIMKRNGDSDPERIVINSVTRSVVLLRAEHQAMELYQQLSQLTEAAAGSFPFAASDPQGHLIANARKLINQIKGKSK